MVSRKDVSPLAQVVNNYSNYNLIYLYDKRIPNIRIERANYKNIYIYYIDKEEYDYIFLYNKSNKFYRLMIRNDKNTKDFLLVNEFHDTKVQDYFLFDSFIYINKEEYTLNSDDYHILEILRKIDI